MLMRTIHSRVHGHFPLDQLSLIRPGQQLGENVVPGTVATEPVVPFPHRLSGTEALRQIPPRNPRPIPVDNPLDNAAAILKRTPTLRRWTGHHRRDQRPLGICQKLDMRQPKIISNLIQTG